MEGFQYVLDIPSKPSLCFGSKMTREALLMSSADAEVPGVGSYDVTLEGERSAKMCKISRLPRWTYQTTRGSPECPFALGQIEQKCIKRSAVPFNQSGKRKFQGDLDSNPGPGTYKSYYVKQHMQFNCSFGGRKTIVPAVDLKCVSHNDDLCSKCGIECSIQGDYWHRKNKTFICRACMHTEYEAYKNWREKMILEEFKLIRDCSFAHYHELPRFSVKLMGVRQIRKKIYTETYLSNYFSHIGNTRAPWKECKIQNQTEENV